MKEFKAVKWDADAQGDSVCNEIFKIGDKSIKKKHKHKKKNRHEKNGMLEGHSANDELKDKAKIFEKNKQLVLETKSGKLNKKLKNKFDESETSQSEFGNQYEKHDKKHKKKLEHSETVDKSIKKLKHKKIDDNNLEKNKNQSLKETKKLKLQKSASNGVTFSDLSIKSGKSEKKIKKKRSKEIEGHHDQEQIISSNSKNKSVKSKKKENLNNMDIINDINKILSNQTVKLKKKKKNKSLAEQADQNGDLVSKTDEKEKLLKKHKKIKVIESEEPSAANFEKNRKKREKRKLRKLKIKQHVQEMKMLKNNIGNKDQNKTKNKSIPNGKTKSTSFQENIVSKEVKRKQKLIEKLKKDIRIQTIEESLVTEDIPEKNPKKVLSLRQKMMDKLKAARFRFLNEQIYTTSSSDAQNIFKKDPEAFDAYHEGYRQQVTTWPLNPLDIIIKSIKKMNKSHIVADFGCGDAKLSKSVDQKVHSFDLVAKDETVTACDMAHVPLAAERVNVAVFCLSLMSTNLQDYLVEANRVLKIGGILKIAEVESRFENIDSFIDGVERFGFKKIYKDLSHNLFYFIDFKKESSIKHKKKLPTVSLHPCLYKKR